MRNTLSMRQNQKDSKETKETSAAIDFAMETIGACKGKTTEYASNSTSEWGLETLVVLFVVAELLVGLFVEQIVQVRSVVDLCTVM